MTQTFRDLIAWQKGKALHYVNEIDAVSLLKACDELSRILNGLINSVT